MGAAQDACTGWIQHAVWYAAHVIGTDLQPALRTIADPAGECRIRAMKDMYPGQTLWVASV